MIQDSVSSTWESMANWFTPTILFLLLNLMIGIIAFTSSLTKPDNVSRSTKLAFLRRLKSTNLQTKRQSFDSDSFYDGIESHAHYIFQHAMPTTAIQSDPQVETRFSLETQPPIEAESDSGAANCLDLASTAHEDSGSLSEVHNQVTGNQIDGFRSASLGLDFRHGEEANDEDDLETRQPVTALERGSSKGDGDKEVDARADDFINKFKHQLKLQRAESLLRAAGAKM